MRWFLLLVLTLLPAFANAGIVLSDDNPDLPGRTPLTLVSQQVDVNIVDQVATTTLVQVFRNDGSVATAGTYVLPLSEQASVMEYSFWLDGRRVRSTIQGKDDAEKTVEQAEAAGEEASSLAWNDPDSFTARFTTLDVGETRRFEVVYSELLPYEAGTVRYSHPLDYATMGLPPVEDVRIDVTVVDSKPISSMAPTSMRLTDTVPDQDFQFDYQLESTDFGLSFRTFREAGEQGFFVATVAPREQTTDDQIVRKDVAFVFDVSGSMSGIKIAQARSALKACLNLMNPGDGAYVVAFNDGLSPYKNKVGPVDAGAHAFVDGLAAGGGTEIQNAMLSTLDVFKASERPTAIVFLTDGNGRLPVEDTLRKVHDAAGPTRIFSFGVGSSVNQAFLERLAHENRGSYTAINGSVAIDDAVREFYASISQPVLTDLEFDFGDVVANRAYPAVMPDVYKGQRLVITGRYRGVGEQTLTVTGRIGGEERNLELPIDFTAEDTEHPWVARMWAKRRSDHLLADIRMYGETPEAKDEIIALSSNYQFATPYTSLVAHADPRVASLTPARIKPGDPVLAIPAPSDSVAVTAFLPFGEVKDLVYDTDAELWVTRFLVPRSAVDGVYWIHIVATDRTGRSEFFKLAYTVDTLAPVMQVALDDDVVAVGGSIDITARPVIGFLELGTEMVRALGRDAAARAKAFVDVKTVVARLAGTDLEVPLRSSVGGAPGWHGSIDLPLSTPAGTYSLEITATDVAGNKHTVTTDVYVERTAVVGVL